MRAAWVALLTCVACEDALPPEGQVLLHVTTDAPLPPGPGEVATVPALFDRLRIEIYPPAALVPCEGCVREFGVDASTSASLGIVPAVGVEGYRVRVRLFRSGGTASGEPRAASTLDTVVALPSIEAEGLVEVSVLLRTDDVGVALGNLDAPVGTSPGPPPAGLVGSWPGAAIVDCAEPPGPGEACVPGGAFWMGDPRLRLEAAPELEGSRERLVVLSPFFLDAREVTVAELRAAGLAFPGGGGPSDDPHEAGTGIAECTYTSAPGALDERPVNCITWMTAGAYCAAQGKKLPSEAQLEHAMSGRGRSRYVWGNEAPGCSDVVFERGAGSICDSPNERPAVAGMGARDRLSLGGVELVDLSGNLAEWAGDLFQHETEPCWQSPISFDPICQSPSPSFLPGAHPIRGGDWNADELGLNAALRTFVLGELGVSAIVGFRCAR